MTTLPAPAKFTQSKILRRTPLLLVLCPNSKRWNARHYGVKLPLRLQTFLRDRIGDGSFKGAVGSSHSAYDLSRAYSRAAFFGIGDPKDPEELAQGIKAAISFARARKAKKVSLLLPAKVDAHQALQFASAANYEFKVGETKDMHFIKTINLVTKKPMRPRRLQQSIAMAQATAFVRDLVNLPANLMTPAILAQRAKEAVAGNKKVKVKILGKEKLEKLGFAAALSVAQGSYNEPQVVIMEYNGGKKGEAPLAFVGKGVTYDTGGYNLKPTGYIESMKCDMGGAAGVAGMMQYVAATNPKKNVIGIMGCVDNMISDKSYLPGDIINSLSGQTICVTNTDAEGRLVLADCLHYVTTEYKPRAVFDAATLTGAATVALGERMSAVMTNTQPLIEKVKTASEAAFEPVWQLPITKYFRSQIKAKTADLQNWSSNVRAGSSMAGAFLENFVNKTPWVHFDIAGTAFQGKYGTGNGEKGATGSIVRTFAEIVDTV